MSRLVLADLPKIQLLAQPFPPFSIQLPGGKATGLGVEIFHIIAEEIGLTKNDYDVVPVAFKRMYLQVQNANRKVGVAMSRIPQREGLFRWVGPYAKITSGLIAKKEREIQIQNFDELKKYRIATVRNAAPEQALMKNGLDETTIDSGYNPLSNLLKLHRDRVDLMAQPIQSASFIMWQNNLNADDFEVVYKIHQPKLYYVFSKDFSQKELNRFEEALNRFMQTNAYQELVKVYRLNDIDISLN